MSFNVLPTWYFPSYELVLNCFNHHFMEDRKHVHLHVIDFVMAVFEHYFCGGQYQGAIDKLILAQDLDRRVGGAGHWSVPRSNLKYSKATP